MPELKRKGSGYFCPCSTPSHWGGVESITGVDPLHKESLLALSTDQEEALNLTIAAAWRSFATGGQQSPQGIYALVGSVDQICEQVLANRE